jgi:hypothetical protein
MKADFNACRIKIIDVKKLSIVILMKTGIREC